MATRSSARGRHLSWGILAWVLAAAIGAAAAAELRGGHLARAQSQQRSLFMPFIASLGPLSGLPTPGFTEGFSIATSAPRRWKPDDWDITVHRREPTDQYEHAIQASHGPDCGAPPATHSIQSFSDAAYLCKNHLMTSIYASDYGMVYLTPNRMVDFSKGEAVIRFEMSTERTSLRDWVDVWITPYDENLQLALEDWLPDGNGEPRNAIEIRMDSAQDNGVTKTTFIGKRIENFNSTTFGTNGWTGYEQFLTPDAKRRDLFELRITRSHIKFGMPDYNFWWIDEAIDPLAWDKGVVQFGHHSYNPLKGCESTCTPNSWHWDNFTIAPVVPFTMIHADRSIVSPANAATPVRFAKPAPADARLRFTGLSDIQVSFDGGATWADAQKQQQEKYLADHFQSYWTPIPAGASSVLFRSKDPSQTSWKTWMVRDPSIWARSS
ncbi:hypothetical protein F8S13_15690 [Chloroflexia bacterium SDU3-3]|nr:hypothetical protein F8S13_15690 [Chloroflexia bacterium SDU3-3]